MYALSSLVFWSKWFKEFHCYYCGGTEGYVSRPRTWFEQYGLRFAVLRTSRCGDCYRRSYLPMRVPLLPRPEPMRFDLEQMLAATLAAEGKAPQKETGQAAASRHNIA